MLRRMSFSVPGTFAILMLPCSLIKVFSVACVEASVYTFQDINVEGHASLRCSSYSGDKQSNTTPFCIALFR